MILQEVLQYLYNQTHYFGEDSALYVEILKELSEKYNLTMPQEHKVRLRDLKGSHTLSGVDYHTNDEQNIMYFILDDIIYKAQEDPCDGWRSMCEDIVLCKGIHLSNTFNPVQVFCIHDDEDGNDILSVLNMKGGEIIKVGTEHTDDWYPCCIMQYTPENIIKEKR